MSNDLGAAPGEDELDRLLRADQPGTPLGATVAALAGSPVVSSAGVPQGAAAAPLPGETAALVAFRAVHVKAASRSWSARAGAGVAGAALLLTGLGAAAATGALPHNWFSRHPAVRRGHDRPGTGRPALAPTASLGSATPTGIPSPSPALSASPTPSPGGATAASSRRADRSPGAGSASSARANASASARDHRAHPTPSRQPNAHAAARPSSIPSATPQRSPEPHRSPSPRLRVSGNPAK